MKKAKIYIIEQAIVEWICPYCGIANRSETCQNRINETVTMRCEHCLKEVERES